MAEKKKNKDDDAEESKRKGLPAIVLVAVGAILGGAGVVFAIPPKQEVIEAPPPVYVDINVTHPDLIAVEFNPRSRLGKGVARASFKFIYTVREDREAEAFELIKTKWDEVKDVTLTLCKSRSMAELQSESGVSVLKHDLAQEIDRTLFGDNDEHRVAHVSRILWQDLLLQ